MAKTTQIQLRVGEELKNKLKSASDTEGVSLTEFVLQAAIDKADGREFRRAARVVAYVKIDGKEIAVDKLLRVPVVMRVEEKE